jgi:hypothetical protein
MVHLTMFSVARVTQFRMIGQVNNELQRIWKEAFSHNFEELSRHFPGGTKEHHERTESGLTGLRAGPSGGYEAQGLPTPWYGSGTVISNRNLLLRNTCPSTTETATGPQYTPHHYLNRAALRNGNSKKLMTDLILPLNIVTCMSDSRRGFDC